MAIVVHHVPHKRDNPYPGGRHVEHDERSRGFAFEAGKPGVDRTLMWSTTRTILNQKDLGACVGFTGADLLNTDMFAPVRKRFHAGKLYGNKDGIDFYHLATAKDSFPGTYPPDDTGSSGLGLAKALKAAGLIDRYTHAFSFDAFRSAIATQPVAVGTVWTNDMFNPDPDGLIHVGDLSDSNIAGGHEYMVRGINYETRRVRMRNHWAKSWGIAGEAEIGFDDFEALLANQGDVTVLHGAGLP
jgi:hypothetical protein